MTAFRPSFEALENRDTPSASITFTVPNGAAAIGSFTFPQDLIDLSQPTQSVPISDLLLAVGGQNYSGAAFTTPPTADFVGGSFVGITFALNGIENSTIAYLGVADAAVTAIAPSGTFSTSTSTVSISGVPSIPLPLTPETPPSMPNIAPSPDDLAQLKEDYDFDLFAMAVMTGTMSVPKARIDALTAQNNAYAAEFPTATQQRQSVLIVLTSQNDAEILANQIIIRNIASQYTATYNDAVADYQILRMFLPAADAAKLVAPTPLILPKGYLPRPDIIVYYLPPSDSGNA